MRAFLLAILVVGLTFSGMLFDSTIVPHKMVCEEATGGDHENCTAQLYATYLFFKLLDVLNVYNGLLIFLVTVVLAHIAGQQRKVTADQVDYHRRTERAYIYAGPLATDILHTGQRRFLKMHAVNYGKTPGIITEFMMGFLDERPTRSPNFEDGYVTGQHARTCEALPPGAIKTPPVDYEVPLGQCFVVGFVKYKDIFGAKQHSNFCVELTAASKVRPCVDVHSGWNEST